MAFCQTSRPLVPFQGPRAQGKSGPEVKKDSRGKFKYLPAGSNFGGKIKLQHQFFGGKFVLVSIFGGEIKFWQEVRISPIYFLAGKSNFGAIYFWREVLVQAVFIFRGKLVLVVSIFGGKIKLQQYLFFGGMLWYLSYLFFGGKFQHQPNLFWAGSSSKYLSLVGSYSTSRICFEREVCTSLIQVLAGNSKFLRGFYHRLFDPVVDRALVRSRGAEIKKK